MSQPNQPPPLHLLRLREADVVRLCGLGAAAQGMELLTRRAITQPRRDGPRLSGVIEGVAGAESMDVAAALLGEPPDLRLRWQCTLDAPADEEARPGCQHIAALLMAWIRAPADFVTPLAEAPAAPWAVAPGIVEQAAREQRERIERAERGPAQPIQPRLLAAPRQSRPQTPLTLADEINRLPAQEASAIARRTFGAEMGEAEARAKLASALRDRAILRTLVGRLDAEAAETLAWLRLAGGALTAADLEALALRAGKPASVMRAALGALERHGLVFAALLGSSASPPVSAAPQAEDEDPGWRRLKGWRIAPETREALANDLPITAIERLDQRPGATQARARVEAGSARALLLGLALLARAPAPLGPFALPVMAAPERDAPGKMERRGRAGSALAPEDLPDAQAHELARGVGVDADVLRVARRTLLWAREQEAAQPVTDLARVPIPARPHAYRAGFRVWLSARSPAELLDLERLTRTVRLRYDHTHEAFRPAALAEEAAEARTFIVRLVGQARPAVWYRVADLLDLVWRVNPTFLRGRQMAFSAPAWRIERVADGRPLRPTVRAEWDAAEGAYIRALLRGPLRWWGVADLASEADGASEFFRLTPLGVFLLERSNERGDDAEVERRAAAALSFDWGPMATQTREGALATQPLAAPAALLDLLERWSAPPTLAGGRLIYSFDADHACANFDLGLRPDDALATLRSLGLTRAAQTLSSRLEGWRAGYGDARVSANMTLVEGRDEATLREALASLPGLAERARWLSASQVALTQADGAALREALARKGWEL